MRTDEAAAAFEDLRPYLHGVAYRLTSSWADAEDVVADTWPRWHEHATAVNDPRAWLTRVVSRLALDHLRSARVRREAYVGPWLPEPLVTVPQLDATGPRDPLNELVQDESVRFAFLVVLNRLTPEQRVALVLHDVLDLPFSEVAEVLGCTVEAARQHASRARRRVEADQPPARAVPEASWQVLADLGAALREGDAGRLARLLAPDVVLVADGAGQVNAAGRALVGATEVHRFLVGLAALADRLEAPYLIEPFLINGDPGFVVRLASPRPRDPRTAAYSYAVRDGKIIAIYAVLAPDKITRIPPPAPGWPAHTPHLS